MAVKDLDYDQRGFIPLPGGGRVRHIGTNEGDSNLLDQDRWDEDYDPEADSHES